MTVVEIGDRSNWQMTYRETADWMIANYPQFCQKADDPRRVYNGWDVSFGLDTMKFHFEDPQVAMHFKLTFA